MLRGTNVLAILVAAAPGMAMAQAEQGRDLLSFADGEARTVGTVSYTARGDVLAILVRSPELVSMAVLDGRLTAGGRSAGAGEALVTTGDGQTRRFGFDAARLAATLRPDWAARARPPLDRIASVQRRQFFWGRIEPVGLNAAAPRGAGVEAARAMAGISSAPGAPTAQERALAGETERLRLAMAYDPAAAIALRAPAEQDALIRALATGEGDGDLRARWFMAGAIQQPAIGMRTFLYNPLARGWLVLAWQQAANGSWQIASARLDSSGLVGWMGGDRPYLAGLVADYAAARTRLGDQPGDLAGMEADRWITGLAEFNHDPARRAAASAARTLIAEGHTRARGGGAIDLMPLRARATYAPIAAFQRGEGGRSLLFGSALYPHILIAADFDDGERPTLARVTLVNLDNAGQGL